MNFLKIILPAVLLFGILVACAGNQNKCGEELTTKSLQNDTVKTLAPGTAEILGKIISINQSHIPYLLKIYVDEISGYGAATPLIAPADTLIFEMMKNDFEKMHSGDGTEITENETYVIRLKSFPAGRNTNEKFSWKIISMNPGILEDK